MLDEWAKSGKSQYDASSFHVHEIAVTRQFHFPSRSIITLALHALFNAHLDILHSALPSRQLVDQTGNALLSRTCSGHLSALPRPAHRPYQPWLSHRGTATWPFPWPPDHNAKNRPMIDWRTVDCHKSSSILSTTWRVRDCRSWAVIDQAPLAPTSIRSSRPIIPQGLASTSTRKLHTHPPRRPLPIHLRQASHPASRHGTQYLRDHEAVVVPVPAPPACLMVSADHTQANQRRLRKQGHMSHQDHQLLYGHHPTLITRSGNLHS